MGLPLLALVTTSCNRDPLAPDCFVVENGQCQIPYPGASDVTASCEDIPDGAVGAEYTLDLNDYASGGTGVYGDWVVTALPPGLSLDADTGIISGIPTEPGAVALEVTVTDLLTGEPFDFVCGEIGINERLSSFDVRFEENHCIPHTASRDEMVAMLSGGDGSEITCQPLNDAGLPCPYGDGNGRPPPGISFNDSSCTHSGDITGDRRGTWVWMVEIEQSGYTTTVPFCASRDVDTFHDITVDVGGDVQSDLVPGLFEYDPDSAPVFGQGDYQWTIDDSQCVNDPSLCNSYGFVFDVTCSPFDPPFPISDSSTDIGLTHDLTAMGPVASESFRDRPWVASFNFSYCTSDNGADCDVEGGSFAPQTEYHFDVVAFPIEP